MAKQTNTLQSIPAGNVIKNLIVQPARVESADIGTWRTALNSASSYGDRTKLYDLMDNVMMDPVLSSAVERRINKITNAEITFMQNGKSVDAIDEMIDTPEFEDLIKEIALSRAYGKSVVEVGFIPKLNVFSFPRKNIRITNLEKPLSERKRFIALKPHDRSGYDYTEDEFIIEAGGDNDFGYIFKAAAYVIYKRGGFGDWAQYAEVFGMPFLLGTYNSMDETQRDQLFKALSAIGGKPVAAIPEGTNLKVHDVGGKSTDLFERFKKACDEEILISVLGQTMTTTEGSSEAQARIHAETEEGIAQSDRRYVQRMLNRFFVPLLVKRGYKVQGGFFLFPDQGEDISTKDRLEMGFKMRNEGLDVDEDYFFEITGIPRAASSNSSKKKEEVKKEEKQEGEKKDKADVPEEKSEQQLVEDDIKPLSGNREKGFFKWLSDFFADARTQWSRASQNLQERLTLSTRTNIELSDALEGIDIDKLFERALKNIYKKRGGKIPLVESNLFNISNQAYQNAVDSEFTSAGVEFGKKNEDFINEFKHNAAVFAAFKNHRQTSEIAEQLLDENGNLRSFHAFKKAVLGTTIKGDYNQRWLQTEYNIAVRSSRMAAKFKKYEATKHIYPNLEYMPSTAATPREEHKEYYGVILPIEHPWWDTHTPPLDWGCECGIRNTDKPVTKVPVGDKPTNPVFSNNPGRTAEIVNMKEHPYVKGVTDVKKQLEIKTFAEDNGGEWKIVKTNKGKLRVHKNHGKNEKKENTEIAQYLANKYEYEIDLIKRSHIKKTADSYNKTLGYHQEYIRNYTATLSAIDNAIRKSKNQANNIVLDIKSEIAPGILRNAIQGRVKRSKNIERVTVIRDNNDKTYTRDEIVKPGWSL